MNRKREGKEMESSSCGDGSGRVCEVFLNFRGPDTRLTIADCLYNEMIRAGICVFKDDEKLRVGEEIGGSLLRAINTSRIYIPIFSKNYAESKWCLRELAHIVKLRKDNDTKVILPIFWDVDANDVKLKTSLYREALLKHERDSGQDTAKQWEEALREVPTITGWNLKDHGQYELMNLTVKEVSSLLWTRQTDMPDLVGLDNRIDDIMRKLELEAYDVRYIVIHGMGGIGKTTLADVVYKQISPLFQNRCCFLKDVRTNDILNLQKKLLFDILNLIDLSDDEVADMVKTRFYDKKVLIVLDDIDNLDQIMRLAGHPRWFGQGSRIIVTTRNIEFLVKEGEDDNITAFNSGKYLFYDMPEMHLDDALHLFCKRALGCVKPPPDYRDISYKLINMLGGLPLALDVVGSKLSGKCRGTWEDILCKLKKTMNEDVKKKLMISYEALEPIQRQIFLDIACFFIHQGRTTAIKYWDAFFGYPTENEVKILTRMSLVKIIGNDKLWMHNQLRDLGRDIAHPKSSKDHPMCTRLWSPEDASHLVQTNTGNKDIVALNLGTPKPIKRYTFKRNQFVGLVNLRFFHLDHGNFQGDFEELFHELRWFSWSNCPWEFKATNFGLKNLAVLMLSGGYITENWKGWCQIMEAKQLKVLQLEHCPFLRKTPKFSQISQLERLIIRCTELRKIDKSIGILQHLDYLEIECDSLGSLPDSIGGLKSLTELRVKSHILSMLPHSIGNLVKVKRLILFCGRLRELPDSVGQLESLLELDVQYSKISVLPDSFGKLERLKVLQLPSRNLEKLPDTMGGLQSLLKLDLSGSKIRRLPDCVGDLKKLKVLNLNSSCIRELPQTIGMLENLEELQAVCELSEIPSEIGALSSLKTLNLSGGYFSGWPTTINQLTNLRTLGLHSCNWIQKLPVLPDSLRSLSFELTAFTTTPDFSNLTNLVNLDITGTPEQEPKIEGLVRLRALRYLRLCIKGKTLPPTDLSSLSQLRHLDVSDPRSLISLPSSLQLLFLQDVQSEIDWSLFSNLENLSELTLHTYELEEIRFEVLGKLPKFRELKMFNCPLLKRLPVLPCLKEIQVLRLHDLPQLTEIQGLGELKSLQELIIWHCNSIKSLKEFDLSNLHNLKKLDFYRCGSLESVFGMPDSCELIIHDCPRFNRHEQAAETELGLSDDAQSKITLTPPPMPMSPGMQSYSG